MLVNQGVINRLLEEAGTKRTEKARAYQELGRVKILNSEYLDSANFSISSIVIGSERYHTYFSILDGEIEDVTCECQDYETHYGICKHSLASVLVFSEQRRPKEQEKTKIISRNDKNEYRAFHQMVTTLYNEEVEGVEEEQEIALKQKGTIRIEPKILYDKFSTDMKVEFKIGNKKMYKIKNLSEFYTRMLEKEHFRYGEKLQFIHVREMFEEKSQSLLDFILRYAEIIKYANSNANSNYRYYGKALSETTIMLGNSGLDEFFDLLKGQKVNFQKEYQTEETTFTEELPKIQFQLKKIEEDQYKIVPNIEIFNVSIIKGKQYKYILDQKTLYRCTKEFENTSLKLLELFRQNYMAEVKLGKQELIQLFSVVKPKVKHAILLDQIPEEELQKYQPKELIVKVYLDFDENDFLIAEVKFCYEEIEINPLDESIKENFPRNKIEETKALNLFRKTGFMLDTKNLRFILPDNDKIYEFLTQDISYYMQKFEVLATEKFKTKQIRQPKVGNLGVKVENNLLTIDLKQLEIDAHELKEIMSKYTLKKKYHRLKDGSFLELEENKEIDFLDKLVTGMDLDYRQLETGEVNLPIHRSLYLNQLLKGMKGTQVLKNTEYKEIVNQLDKEKLEEEIEVPEHLKSVLRYYQKTGFQWLKILDQYKFGGILADDMGLRKNSSDVSCYC